MDGFLHHRHQRPIVDSHRVHSDDQKIFSKQYRRPFLRSSSMRFAVLGLPIALALIFFWVKRGDSGMRAKPVMHTFYQPAGSCDPVSEEGHQNLLRAWEQGWQARGWATKIHNEDDARKHKDFDAIEAKLKKLGADQYNRQCFYRWLAMAASPEGGWMSDYDTFPLKLSSEKGKDIMVESGGTFSSYAMHVPCLIYANATEWERVLQEMVKIFPDPEKEHGHVSDMNSLMDFSQQAENTGGMIFKSLVWSAFHPKRRDGFLGLDCGMLHEQLAIHMSHHYVEHNFKHMSFGPFSVKSKQDAWDHREVAALEFMKLYEVECLQP